MKYIPKYQKGSIARPRIESAVITEPRKFTGDPNKYPDQTKTKRNIHTNQPVITPYNQ